MRVATEPRRARLPKSFPIGAVYVVEGKGGEHGALDVSARYVVMPGGKRIDVAAKRPQPAAAAAPARRHLVMRLAPEPPLAPLTEAVSVGIPV